MPVLFEGNCGRVSAIADRVATGAIQLANVSGAGGNISYQQHNTIITRLGCSMAGNFQFMHTIGNDVYVYTFGDRMGQVVLNGLSFSAQCPDDGSQQHGFEKLMTWYRANRIASRKGAVRVIIGRSTVLDGFVTALTADLQDALHRTIQFQMTISMLPDVL